MLAIRALCLVPLICETPASPVFIFQFLFFWFSILYGVFGGFFLIQSAKDLILHLTLSFGKCTLWIKGNVRHENQRVAKDRD